MISKNTLTHALEALRYLARKPCDPTNCGSV